MLGPHPQDVTSGAYPAQIADHRATLRRFTRMGREVGRTRPGPLSAGASRQMPNCPFPRVTNLRPRTATTVLTWHDHVVNDYVVAAHESPRRRRVDQVPLVKHHAYLAGVRSTVCGFGLESMRVFEDLHFRDQLPGVRCPICSRIVGSNDR